ncbi:kinase domain protein, putative, partial [Rhizoctonia solani AG-3 Rhs1AP]
MDQYIESELQDAIFHDPNFIKRFLSSGGTKLERVHEECGRLDGHYRKMSQWKLPSIIKTEKSLYQPVLDILNTIKTAVDTLNPPTHTNPPRDQPVTPDSGDPLTSDDDLSGDFIPDQPQFINTSAYTIGSDRAETELIKPDLVLFEDVEEQHRHWEHVRMPIEVKKLTGYHKAAMKQLSRYARAVFAHQLHRRHLYAMMVCNTEATFVRFDRAGILYSRRINLRTDSKAFTLAFAALLMLDRTDQGYDPAFACEINIDGRLDYYVDLPASTFTIQKPSTGSAAAGETKTSQFKVVDILCHRRSICGRATIVLRIRKVENDDDGDGDEYILKIMWRDPERGLEGEVLRKVKGKFGLAQYVWHGDAFGKCLCSPTLDARWECTSCVAETVQTDELEVCDKLTDITIEVPPEDEKSDKDPELTVVDTTVLMSSKGVPLERAESPRQFMQAVLDAIIGYWELFNLGILHRDISEGNVMMLSSEHQTSQRFKSEPNVTSPKSKGSILVESEKKLREVLEQLGDHQPTGMLSDFDLHAFHSLDLPCEAPVNPLGSGFTVTGPDAAGVPSSQPPAPPVSPRFRSSRPRDDNMTTDLPVLKKRRLIGRHRPSGNVTNNQLPVQSNSGEAGERKRVIDFRTGTPAFMSVRVLTVQAGDRYHHSFMDDLESFFWLVLWSAAAHLDPGRSITPDAQLLLNRLNQKDLISLRNEKAATLFNCHMQEGKDMLDLLELVDNEWATHPIFVDVIIEFGKLAHSYYGSQNANHCPIDVFSTVIRIFQDALASNDD